MNSDPSKPINLDFWGEKPFWCQPWSIILTGVSIIVISLLWPGIIWISALLTILIVLWWMLFLVIAPSLYRDQDKVV